MSSNEHADHDDGPRVGSWWDAAGWRGGTELVVLSHPPTENSGGTKLIDSNLNHFEEWDTIAGRLNRTRDDEYFDIPRGRVLLHRSDGSGLIYHGSSTGPDRLKVIAEAFGLTAWESRLDEHYEMISDDDAADELFGWD